MFSRLRKLKHRSAVIPSASLAEIQASTRLNEEIVDQALSQAEKRLADALETKGGFETKASALLSCWIAVATGLFGAAQILDKASVAPAAPFWVAGAFFVAGAICFVLVLWGSKYGALGSNPRDWLNIEILCGGKTVLTRMNATLVHFYIERIDATNRANNRKAYTIRAGMALGVIGSFAACAVAYLQP